MINNLLKELEERFPVVRLTNEEIFLLKEGTDIDYYIGTAEVGVIKNYLIDRNFFLLEHSENKLKVAIFVDCRLCILDFVLNFNYLNALFPKTELRESFVKKAIEDATFLDFFQTIFFLKNKPNKLKLVNDNFNDYRKYFFDKKYVSSFFLRSNVTRSGLTGVLNKKYLSLLINVKLFDLLCLVYKTKVSRFFNFKKGQIVAIVGPDGSGKSTVIDKLTNIPMVKSYYMGDKNYHFQSFYHWLMKQNKYIARIVYLFMFAETWFRYFYLFFLKIQGYIVLTDRYPGMNRSASSVETQHHPYVLMYRYLYPEADKYILITASPDLIFERKQELTVSEIKTYQEYIRHRMQKMRNAKEIPNLDLNECLNQSLFYIFSNKAL